MGIKTKKLSLPVTGMSCAGCAANVEKSLKTQTGIHSAAVNFANAEAVIEFNPDEIDFKRVEDAITQRGFGIIIDEENKEEIVEQKRLKASKTLNRKLLIAIIFSIPIFLFSMIPGFDLPYEHLFLLGLSIPVIIYSGSEFYLKAFKQIRYGNTSMDTLVSLGTLSAFSYSLVVSIMYSQFKAYQLASYVYFESAAFIITFILLGRYLEDRAKNNTSSAVRKLVALTPKEVNIIRDGIKQSVHISQIRQSDTIEVFSGERIAVDGKIISGEAAIDEQMLSGEPLPVDKSPGASVYAGTVVLNGSITVEALKASNQTVLSQIIRQIREAQSRKPKVQQLADRISSVFVPLILLISLFTFLYWLLLDPSEGIGFAISCAISVLIIACPCALGLATPTAITVALGKAANNGLLMKNADSIQQISAIDHAVFDKTGTLTKGKPVIENLEYHAEDHNQINSMLNALSSQSSHPYSKAIQQHFNTEAPNVFMLGLKETGGKGLTANINGSIYWLGNEKLMKTYLAETEHTAQLYFGRKNELLATISFTDQLRSEAIPLIDFLKKKGIETTLLSGDHKDTVKAVAKETGIQHYLAGVLPTEKTNFINDLQSKGHRVCMLGDGINDAAALSQSDLGIAMSGGSDISIANADITLLNANLSKLEFFFHLAKKSRQVIKQNLFWAFIYNILAIPLAAGLFYHAFDLLLNPMIAGAAMALSSITVVLNSLRLMRIKN